MRLTANFWISAAGINGFIGVAMAAVSAHMVTDSHLSDLGVKGSNFEILHALALLILASAKGPFFACSRWFFLLGILFFSGSLYALAFFGPNATSFLAPLGGILLMAGWAMTVIASRLKAAH